MNMLESNTNIMLKKYHVINTKNETLM